MSAESKYQSHIDHIIQSEATYLAGIELLNTAYRDAIVSHCGVNVAETILQGLSSIVDTSKMFHAKLLHEMEKDDETRSLGKVFLEMQRFFLCYKTYLSNYSDGDVVLRKEMKNSRLSKALAAADAEHPGNDILALRILPVQRMPRYALLLRDLVKHHREYSPYEYEDRHFIEAYLYDEGERPALYGDAADEDIVPYIEANLKGLDAECCDDASLPVAMTDTAHDMLLALAKLTRVTDELNATINEADQRAMVQTIVRKRVKGCPEGAPDGHLPDRYEPDSFTEEALAVRNAGHKLSRVQAKRVKIADREMAICKERRRLNKLRIEQPHRLFVAEVGPVYFVKPKGKEVKLKQRWLIVLNDIIIVCKGQGPRNEFYQVQPGAEPRDGSTDVEPLVYDTQLRLDTSHVAMFDNWCDGIIPNLPRIRSAGPWKLGGRPSLSLTDPEIQRLVGRTVVFQSKKSSHSIVFDSTSTAFMFIKAIRRQSAEFVKGLPSEKQWRLAHAPLIVPPVAPAFVAACMVCGILQTHPERGVQCDRCGRVTCAAVREPRSGHPPAMACAILTRAGEMLCRHCYADDEFACPINTAFAHYHQAIERLQATLIRRGALPSSAADDLADAPQASVEAVNTAIPAVQDRKTDARAMRVLPSGVDAPSSVLAEAAAVDKGPAVSGLSPNGGRRGDAPVASAAQMDDGDEPSYDYEYSADAY